MHFVRRRVVAAAIAGSMLAGGAIGATVFSAGSSVAANTTPTQGAPAPPNGRSADGRFHPNENSTHEGKESKQREAQEDAGQFPTVP
jgi:Cu/Zn superoxide dismutase